MPVASEVLRCIHQKQTPEALALIVSHLFSTEQRKMIWEEAFRAEDVLFLYRLGQVWKDGLTILDELPVMQRALLGRAPRLILERAYDPNWDPSVDINQAIEGLRPIGALKIACVAHDLGKPVVLTQDNTTLLASSLAHVWFSNGGSLFDRPPYHATEYLLNEEGWSTLFDYAQKEIDGCNEWQQDKAQSFAAVLAKQAMLRATQKSTSSRKTKKASSKKL